MGKVRVSKTEKSVIGTIELGGSKSISNRVLLIQALCDQDFAIHNLSDSDDTKTFQKLLASTDYELDAHHAGTTFRFMTSYLATKAGEQVLTGSERMQERPIRELAEALIRMGADIQYVNKEGYPPLKIGEPKKSLNHKISVASDISSQYISSLLLIAPTLPDGLEINLVGEIVSRPYLDMTLRIMEYFGVSHEWNEQLIKVAPQAYKARDFYVEADWSAASYYYIMAALAEEAELTLKGLFKESLQGDRSIVEISELFGVETTFGNNEIYITKSGQKPESFVEYDFIQCPDIAQSVSTMAAGLGVSILFSGLQTLRIKETDRISALQSELAKIHVYLSRLPERFSKNSGVEYYMQEGHADGEEMAPTFATYKDHRMAMAFGPLAILFPIEVEDHMVVTKSYPNYWEDLKSLDFLVEGID